MNEWMNEWTMQIDMRRLACLSHLIKFRRYLNLMLKRCTSCCFNQQRTRSEQQLIFFQFGGPKCLSLTKEIVQSVVGQDDNVICSDSPGKQKQYLYNALA